MLLTGQVKFGIGILTKVVFNLFFMLPNNVTSGGMKKVISVVPSEKGQTITILSYMNATGQYVPPGIIFKGKSILVGKRLH